MQANILQEAGTKDHYNSGMINDRFQILGAQFQAESFYVYDFKNYDVVRDKNGAIAYFGDLAEAKSFCGLDTVKAAKVVKAPKAVKVAKVNVKQAKGTRMTTKAELALVLFKENPAMTNAELIQLFIEKLGMTKLGARTYVYNVRKQAAQ